MLVPMKLGSLPQMSSDESLSRAKAAAAAWDGGFGAWPQMSQEDRIVKILEVMEKFVEKRTEIVDALMREIGKNYKDAESEFDRTIDFVKRACEELRSGVGVEERQIGKVLASVRRGPLGD